MHMEACIRKKKLMHPELYIKKIVCLIKKSFSHKKSIATRPTKPNPMLICSDDFFVCKLSGLGQESYELSFSYIIMIFTHDLS